VSISFPHNTFIVFAPCNYSVALLVECTRKHFIFVPLQTLDHDSTLSVPHLAGVVRAGGDDACALIVELALADLLLMSHEHADALAGHSILNASSVV